MPSVDEPQLALAQVVPGDDVEPNALTTCLLEVDARLCVGDELLVGDAVHVAASGQRRSR